MPVLNIPQVERWIRAVAAQYGFSVGDLNYIFCDDAKILEVNREFLQHDYYTDVITFDYTTRTRVNGDIFISLDTIRTNAEEVGASFNHELHRVIIHGLLHLTGQADKTPETKVQMTAKEDAALKKITINE
ncbi:MAG: rRNA maturation RNase YbeY [Paludibacteraceae bacterium]|jgi:rRNA maturation RNase YbeY|nr:rRNA maturation RNase YbeY [Paludibacteraceae bacterium]